MDKLMEKSKEKSMKKSMKKSMEKPMEIFLFLAVTKIFPSHWNLPCFQAVKNFLSRFPHVWVMFRILSPKNNAL